MLHFSAIFFYFTLLTLLQNFSFLLFAALYLLAKATLHFLSRHPASHSDNRTFGPSMLLSCMVCACAKSHKSSKAFHLPLYCLAPLIALLLFLNFPKFGIVFKPSLFYIITCFGMRAIAQTSRTSLAL